MNRTSRRILFALYFILILLILLVAGCDVWGLLDNPVDVEAGNFQGFLTLPAGVAVTLSEPADSSSFDYLPDFVACAVENAAGYGLQISSDATFETIDFEIVDQLSNTFEATAASLASGDLYWRCRAKNQAGDWGAWSGGWLFSLASGIEEVSLLPQPASITFPYRGAYFNIQRLRP